MRKISDCGLKFKPVKVYIYTDSVFTLPGYGKYTFYDTYDNNYYYYLIAF